MTTLLGRFDIDSEIGRGAMGIVYRGRDTKINRIVAIKTISIFEEDPQEEREFRERFFLEAQAAGGLSHPGIVTIFDVGEEPASKLPYIVMEYVEGRTLSKILRETENRKLPLGPALQLAQEIAEALHYAHGRGVIHRDIKPANIIVTREGHTKIADFGIAKVNESQMTLPGRALGSPAYMAPEQFTGAQADARSDLFSLGVILYTILTGHRPFQGNSATTVMTKVAHHDPLPITIFESDFPPALNRIVLRAIAKDPAERYQNGAELADDLYKLRASENLLDETAVSLAAVRLAAPVAIPSKFLGESAFGQAQKPRGRPSAFVTRGTFTQVTDFKGTLLVAVLVMVGAILVSRLPSRHPARSVTANTIPVATPNPSTDQGLALTQLPTASAPPIAGKRPNKVPSPSVRPRPKAAVSPALAASKPEPPEPAVLEIEIRHHFVIARASVWLDNNLVLEKELEGVTKKHALVFQRTKGFDAATVKLAPGAHTVRVRVQSGSDSYDRSKTISGTLVSGRQNTLLVTCDRRHDLLNISFQ